MALAAAAAVALGVAACAASTPLRADATERETCGEVEELGFIVDAFVTGKARAGDPRLLEELAEKADAVDQAAAATANAVLAREGRRAAEAAAGMAEPPASRPRELDASPDGLVYAYRSLTEECRLLGVPVEPDR